MYSIVVQQHTHKNEKVTTIIGMRLENTYEDMRNIKVYISLKSAKSAFESRVRKMKGVGHMRNIRLRYMLVEGEVCGVFEIWDTKEKRMICTCAKQKDAGMIAGCLNRDWDMVQDENAVNKMGGYYE
jgi:hypothetical protein